MISNTGSRGSIEQGANEFLSSPIGQALGNQQNNTVNAQQAAANRDWQERMSSTAHQREVQDLKNAGLNPYLTMMGGGGASTPTGSIIPMRSIAEGLPQALHSGASAKLAGSQEKLVDVETSNAKLTGENLKRSGRLIDVQSAKAASEISEVGARTGNILADTKSKKQRHEIDRPGVIIARNEVPVQKSILGKAAPWVATGAKAVSPVIGAGFGFGASRFLKASVPFLKGVLKSANKR